MHIQNPNSVEYIEKNLKNSINSNKPKIESFSYSQLSLFFRIICGIIFFYLILFFILRVTSHDTRNQVVRKKFHRKRRSNYKMRSKVLKLSH